jgi:RHS repeat-associated protein
MRTVLVDNTPPDTMITGGPSGEISVATATFSFTGSDNLTPAVNLLFAWRLDGGAWTAFSGATLAALSGLAEGSHTFQVKALDLAGNEDPTPAVRTFTVRFGPSITSVDPASGAIGTYATITGTNFEPGTTQVGFNGLAAIVRRVTATQITTTVPIGATTGPLVVTTTRGSVSRAFAVGTTGDFTLTAAPTPPATARVIAGDQTSVSIAAGGTGSFTSLVSLTTSTPPSGITTSFSPSNLVAPGANLFVTFGVGSGVTPGIYNFTGTGQAQVDGRSVMRTTSFTLEVLPPNTLAVTGRVLTAEAMPQPISGVTVTLGSAFTLTDAGGNFVLLAPPAGANMLLVDGRTASTPSVQYPPVEVQIAVGASGATRVPFVVYLPKLDTANPVTLPLNAGGFTTQEVKASTPAIPGLVVTIPAGTRIIGPDGTPVSQITITPVPTDRVPMPFPAGVTLPLVFSIQPGGAVPSTPLPITFPNAQQLPPGTRADLYFFDLAIGNWAIWGQGTVSDDSHVIVSNPGAGLPRFAWHGTACQGTCPVGNPGGDRHATGAEPVDLVTGQFTINKTDLVLPGRIVVTIQRSHRSGGTTLNSLFGPGWTLGLYDAVLTPSGTGFQLTKPDQSTYTFSPTAPGQWSVAGEPEFAGAVLTPLPGEFTFQLHFKDGTVHHYDRIIGFANAAGLAAITDRNGNTVTITRGTVFTSSGTPVFGRITQITEPVGRALNLAYDGQGRVQTVTDPINRVVQYGYDAQGRLSTVTDPAGGVTTYAYDSNTRIVSITDPRGITFLTNAYDGQGRVIQQTQADGGVWTFAYTTTGGIVTQTVVTDPRGNPTTHRFNSQGFTLSRTDPLGQTTVFAYAPGSNLLSSTTDRLGRVTRFTYDAQGNVTSVTDPAGNTRTFTYDPTLNKVTFITDPLGQVTQFAYNTQGNLTTITDPLGKRTALTYNGAGQPITTTDPLGNTATFTYDAQGNLATTADPLGNTTGFQYDMVGRLIRQTDPRSKPTAFAYDPLNQITTITDALGDVTRFTFDPNGNLLTVTDARGNAIAHTYDSMERLATRTNPVGAAESFAYDLAGNLTRRTDRKGQVSTFVYDVLNRQTAASYADGAGTSFAYDAAGRLVRVDDSVGGTLTNTYDAVDRLLAQATGLGTVSYQYDALGRRTSLDVPGTTSVTYSYDAASRLTQILQGTQTVGFQYNAAGRRALLTLPNGVTTEYQYDVASRLTALIYRNAAGVLGNMTYQYDPASNRTQVGGSFARTQLPSTVASATHDAANRQLTFGARTLTYDANGNLTSDGTATYTWDARNRLASLSTLNTSASFQYDPLGRRTQKMVNGNATDFAYDGLNPVQELSSTAGVATLLTGLGIDEYLMRTDSGGRGSFLSDALGSAMAIVDDTGTVQTQYTYGPFGSTTVTGQSNSNPFQYTGREIDETGLYYYRARYYMPELSRFISEDPAGLISGSNFYPYALNRPLNFSDPFGLAPQCPDCPGGEWRTASTYNLSLFVIYGGSYTVTSFTCAANGMQCIGETTCSGAGGVFFSPGLTSLTFGRVAGASRAQQLEGVSYGYSSAVGPFSGNFTFAPTARSAYDFPYIGEVGVGKSYGAGIAFFRCETKLVGCLR